MRRIVLLLAVGLVAWLAGSVGSQTHAHGSASTVARAPAASMPPAPVALDSGWTRHRDPGDVGLREGWGTGHAPSGGWRAVSIPNDFNPTPTPAGDRGQVVWYRDVFRGPPAGAGRSWAVSFTGVRRHAMVWLDGVLLGSSDNAFSPFTLAAGNLRAGARNVLIVRVDNFRSWPEDWWNWGGITGPVSLVSQGALSVHQLGVLAQLGCGLRCGWLRIVGSVADHSAVPLTPRLLVSVRAPDGRTVAVRSLTLPRLAPGGVRPLSATVVVRSPLLWSPGHPWLYSVTIQLGAGGRVWQRRSLAVGMRSVRVRNGILYLNDRRLWLRGASIQEDSEGQGAALTVADIARIVWRLRMLGANVTRAHYQLDPRLLDALDRAGIMVWAQPAVDHADGRLASAAGRARALSILRATLLEDRNHPSVIVNSLGNELSPDPSRDPGTLAYLRRALALARELDPGVPVGLDVYGFPGYPAQPFYRRLDALGIDDYFGWYPGPPGHSLSSLAALGPYLRRQHRRYPGQALVVTEYGAEGLYYGAASEKGSYAFQSEYLQRTWAVIDGLPFLNGAIYWTLAEFAVAPGWTGGATLPPGYRPGTIHHKGLISYAGAFKPAFFTAQRLFATPPPYIAPATPRPKPPAAFGLALSVGAPGHPARGAL